MLGSVPKGEAGTVGWSSQTCSGSSPWPEVILRIAVSSDAAVAAVAVLAMSYSPRSPDSTGHRWPVPVSVGGHGAPVTVQLEPLGWKQSP